jgi:acyl-CoA dehydrogenase
MDFEHSAKTRDYMARLTEFMAQNVYPNEKLYHEQSPASAGNCRRSCAS